MIENIKDIKEFDRIEENVNKSLAKMTDPYFAMNFIRVNLISEFKKMNLEKITNIEELKNKLKETVIIIYDAAIEKYPYASDFINDLKKRRFTMKIQKGDYMIVDLSKIPQKLETEKATVIIHGVLKPTISLDKKKFFNEIEKKWTLDPSCYEGEILIFYSYRIKAAGLHSYESEWTTKDKFLDWFDLKE